MTNAWRHWSFTLASLLILLVFTAIGEAWLTLAAAAVVIAFGFILLPQVRTRGALAAVIAAGAAATLALVFRSVS